MAIAIKAIPTLRNEAAKKFVDRAERAIKKRATVKFTTQVKAANKILQKAKMK